MALFGHELTPERPLSQPGQYLAKERVRVEGPKGEFRNVAVLGPERKEAQVEISLTDGKTLGIQPPVRLSGDVQDSPGCMLEGPAGKLRLDQGVIAARRHIHLTPEDAKRFGVIRWCGSGRILTQRCIWITMKPMPVDSAGEIWGGSFHDPGAADRTGAGK